MLSAKGSRAHSWISAPAARGVVGDALRAKAAAQQFLRLGVGEHIQGER